MCRVSAQNVCHCECNPLGLQLRRTQTKTRKSLILLPVPLGDIRFVIVGGVNEATQPLIGFSQLLNLFYIKFSS